MSQSTKICGILGGMGPEATIDLMARIVALTRAADDCDHVHCLVDQNPHVPSRIKALLEGGGPSPGPALAAMGAKLEAAGADFLCIACNTAHNWLAEVKSSVNIPVLDMPALASAEAARLSPGKVCGILASPAVHQQRIFEPHLAKEGARPLYPEPEDEKRLLAIIRNVKAGRQNEHDLAEFGEIASRLAEAGAGSLIIACTELSAMGVPPGLSIPVVDAASSLARAIVLEAGAEMKQDN